MSRAVKRTTDELEGEWYWDCPDCICYWAWFKTKSEAAEAYRLHRQSAHGEAVRQEELAL